MIRILTPDDAASFQQLRLLALQESPDAFGSSYKKEAGKSLEKIIERIQPRENGNAVFGFFADTTALVGIVGFGRDDGPKEHHKGFIWGMYVQPEHRHQGIGFKLVHAAIHHARQLSDIRQIKLTVTSVNKTAERLYARSGFTTYGIEKDSLSSDNGFLDEHLMVLVLG